MRFFSGAGLILFLSLAFQAFGQVVSILPRFPKTTDSLTIIYDATQGNGALKDCTHIYIHSGVVTSGPNGTGWSNVPMTWGTANPKWRMTNLGNNRFQMKYRPTNFYNISASLAVYRLGFVFRNYNGNITGKTATNGDIFMPMYQPGQTGLTFFQPDSKFVLVNLNDPVAYSGGTNVSGNLKILVDGVEVNQVANDTSILGQVPTNTGGTKKVILRHAAFPALKDSFTVRVNQPNTIEALPTGIEDGVNVLSPTSVVFCLRAPFKNVVYLRGEFNNWELSDQTQMKRTPDGKFWWLQVDGLNPNLQYTYQYFVDGALNIADPYSKIILDPNNDSFINSGIYPNLKPYPTGKTTGNVSVFQTVEPEFNWTVTNFKRPQPKDLVVYELLIRDFANAKTYKMLADTLQYLKKLGVNCIEIMPIMEFEGNLSWGYNPSHHYAIDKYYGPAAQFKAFVDKAHSMCIAVVLDIALNHGFGQNPMVQLYWNGAQNRPAANNPWFNEIPKHDFNVGYDFNHQSADTRYYVDRVMKHWLKEYKIDGFRWDLSKGFTQVNTLGNTNAWGNYDASRVQIWKNLYDDMQSYSPCSYCILEHFAANSEETELANYGLMFWGNQNYAYSEAVMGWTNSSDLGWGYYKNRNWQKPHLLSYMESHDEERLMYKCLMYGNNGQLANGYNLRDTTTIINRIKLASTFFYSIPGPKMIWQFGELGYGFSINYPCTNPCTDGSNRTNQKPIRWDYLNEPRRKSLLDVTRSMIALHRFEPVFATEPSGGNFSIGGIALKRMLLTHSSRNVVVLGNFGITEGTITPNFPSTGTWYEFFTGQSINVTNTSDGLLLGRGEYRLYSNVPWQTPAYYQGLFQTVSCTNPPNTDACGNILSTQSLEEQQKEVKVYPNPASERCFVALPYLIDGKAQVSIIDLSGRVLDEREVDVFGGNLEVSVKNLQNQMGLLALRIRVAGRQYLAKLMVSK